MRETLCCMGGEAMPRSAAGLGRSGHAARVEHAAGGVGHARTPTEGAAMADPVPAGSDVSSGTYKCRNCGHELEVASPNTLRPCPSCHNGQYKTLSGGDSA